MFSGDVEKGQWREPMQDQYCHDIETSQLASQLVSISWHYCY